MSHLQVQRLDQYRLFHFDGDEGPASLGQAKKKRQKEFFMSTPVTSSAPISRSRWPDLLSLHFIFKCWTPGKLNSQKLHLDPILPSTATLTFAPRIEEYGILEHCMLSQ